MRNLLCVLILLITPTAMALSDKQVQDISDAIDESEAQIIFSLDEGFADLNKSLEELSNSVSELSTSVEELNVELKLTNETIADINDNTLDHITSVLALICSVLLVTVVFVILGFIVRLMVKP